jgi:hypothetical protein
MLAACLVEHHLVGSVLEAGSADVVADEPQVILVDRLAAAHDFASNLIEAWAILQEHD